jgi:O-antigen/teichoic acid export membrane protein
VNKLEKALKMGKASAIGSLQLFLGKMSSTVILAVGTIVMGWFIAPADYGLYAVSLIPISIVLLFQDWGINSAMTRYCARYRAANQVADLRKIIVAGLTFELSTGLLLTFLSIVLASFFASVFGKPESTLLIIFSSFTILSTSVNSGVQGLFVGFERMKFIGLASIVQAFVQSVFSVILVYLGYGALGAVLGYTLASVASALFSMSVFYFSIFRKLEHVKAKRFDSYVMLKPLLKFGVPLALGTIFAGILSPFFSFMMASYVSTVMIGNYKIATNFAILLAFFSVPISTVLFPAFSKVDPQKERLLLKTIFASSVKYTSLIMAPVALGIFVLSGPLIQTIYADKWVYAPSFLALVAVTNLFVIAGIYSYTNLLSALGETKQILKISLVDLAFAVPIAFILTPLFGMNGVIIGGVLAGVPGLSWGLYFIWKRYGVTVDFKSSAKILLASVVAAVVTYLFLSVLKVPNWAELVAGGVFFLATYLIMVPVVGAINQTDIDALQALISELGVISKILKIPLRILQRILTVRVQL